MTTVFVKDGEAIETALKRFSKKIEEAGLMQEIKSRQTYEKPSDKKRKKKLAGKLRMKKKQAKMDEVIQFENENKFRPKKRRPYVPHNKAPASVPVVVAPVVPKPEPIDLESLENLKNKFSK